MLPLFELLAPGQSGTGRGFSPPALLVTLHAMAKSKQDSAEHSAAATTTEQEALNFEAALAELETLVAQMEGGDLSLDDSLKAFERGIALTRHCSTALKEAELKVEALREDGELVDYDPEDFDDA